MPQGNVIGPLLFILYVNDIPEVTKNTTVALFALFADSKCYRAIQSPADRDILQTDLDSMHNWSISWQLKFNVSKTLLLRVSRKHISPTHSYHLNNQPVKIVANQVNLGVVVSRGGSRIFRTFDASCIDDAKRDDVILRFCFIKLQMHK